MKRVLIASLDNIKKEFKFYVGTRQVCEMGYLRLLGTKYVAYITTLSSKLYILLLTCPGLITSASRNKPEQWTQTKNELLGIAANIGDDNIDLKPSANRKFDHAVVFIKYLAHMFAETGYMDVVPVGEQNVANRPEVRIAQSTEKQIIWYLPYDKPIEIYEEYCAFYKDEEKDLSPSEKSTCSLTTFRIALQSLNKEIKLRTARGAFETCSICNNLNDLLKNTKMKYTKDQLEIVLKLKRLHLQQQATERRDASLRKLQAKTSYIGSKLSH